MSTGLPLAAHHWHGLLALLGVGVLTLIGLACAVLGTRSLPNRSDLTDDDIESARAKRRTTRRLDDERFRWIRLGMLIGCWIILVILRAALFDDGRPPSWWWERLLQQASWFWCAAAPASFIGAISLVLRKRSRPDDSGTWINHLVCFRIVSRGLNVDALSDTVASIREVMATRKLFPYRIEVIVDNEVQLPAADDLTVHVVPTGYTTPNRSKYKARALHYATEVSTLQPSSWVFHCDEESQVTNGLIGGIRDAVAEEEIRSSQGMTPRIGQGTILYTRRLKESPVLTLADSLRTGDDITRFATQFRSGVMFCGMHGSFILCRSDVETSVSFDVGPEGSITEDAFWAYEQAERGVGFRWVDGYLLEQSPESMSDFAKQRRRWYSGLWKVALYAPAALWARLVLMLFLSAWLLSALGGVYTFVNLFTGLSTPWPAEVCGGLVFSWYVTTYLTGLWLSLRSMAPELRPTRAASCCLYVAQVLLMPVFGSLEAAGVFLAVVVPEKGFHVIKKAGSTGGGQADDGISAPDDHAPDIDTSPITSDAR